MLRTIHTAQSVWGVGCRSSTDPIRLQTWMRYDVYALPGLHTACVSVAVMHCLPKRPQEDVGGALWCPPEDYAPGTLPPRALRPRITVQIHNIGCVPLHSLPEAGEERHLLQESTAPQQLKKESPAATMQLQ